MKNKLYWILCIIYILFIGGYYYVVLPPINWHAPEFWPFAIVVCLPIILFIILSKLKKIGMQGFRNLKAALKGNSVDTTTQGKKDKQLLLICIGALAFLFVFPTVASVVTSPLFHAKEYANRIQVKNVKFSEIPEVNFKKTPIIDRDSSERLGDKVMGNMSEWVSQFNVSDEYTQISYKNSVYRVTPLTYNGLIKYFKNKDEGIPAYITVDSTSGKTSLVKLKDIGLDGMKYVPSAMFNENLMRHLRFNYPTEIFGAPSFEIDEDGHPWYICSTYTYKGVGTKKSVTGAIFLDPISGESTRYDIKDVPAWADRIYPESLVVNELDENGSLQDGFFNSIFGQNGVTLTSEGYNYLEKEGDIWLYSGITSANADKSNLGFVLVNLRTHEAMRIASAGADELSAMQSAESEVKNYGYSSTFPLLINIADQPVYLMSLKDNGLIKMYATVSAVDYQQVATVNSDEGLDALVKKTIQLLSQNEEAIKEDSLQKKTITVKQIERVNLEGTTIYYIQSEDGETYKIPFSLKYENQLVFLKPGTKLNIKYISGDIHTIKEIQ